MNTQRDETAVPQQQIIFAEPASLGIPSPLPMTSMLEIDFDKLTPKQQGMVEESLYHHLAMSLTEKKANHAVEGMIRFSFRIGELFVEADFQFDVIEMRANGRPRQERLTQFLDRRRGRVERFLETIEDQFATRLAIEMGKSVYPKLKANDGKGSFLNIRLFTSEKTVIQETPDQDVRVPMTTGTLFGTSDD